MPSSFVPGSCSQKEDEAKKMFKRWKRARKNTDSTSQPERRSRATRPHPSVADQQAALPLPKRRKTLCSVRLLDRAAKAHRRFGTTTTGTPRDDPVHVAGNLVPHEDTATQSRTSSSVPGTLLRSTKHQPTLKRHLGELLPHRLL